MKVLRTNSWWPIARSEILVRRERNRLRYAMQPQSGFTKTSLFELSSFPKEERDFVERT